MQAADIQLVFARTLQDRALLRSQLQACSRAAEQGAAGLQATGTTARTQSVFVCTVQERALLAQAPLFWSSLAPQSVAANTSAAHASAAAAATQQGPGSSRQLLLAAPAQVASGDEAAACAAQAGSLPGSHHLRAGAGADGAASNALLAASQAFYQVHGGI